MGNSTLCLCVLALVFVVASSHGVPKKYAESDGRGFLPSSSNFFPQDDQIAMESLTAPTKTQARRSNDITENHPVQSADTRPQEPRFGFAFPGGIQQQNPNAVYPGYSGQLNLDLGGLVLGAIVGLGAVFILPKILHVFTSNQHGDHYKRRSETSQVAQMMTKVEQTLAKYNIDSSACMQRAVCSYVKASMIKVNEGKASNIDALVDVASSNSIMTLMLDGSTIQRAVDSGRHGANCAHLYPKCPFNKDIVFAAVKGLVGEELLKA